MNKLLKPYMHLKVKLQLRYLPKRKADSGQGWWVKATLSFTERTQATGVQGSVTFVNLLLAVRMPT